MVGWRDRAIDAGMGLFAASGVHRLAAPYTRGLGAILMFHRVRPRRDETFAPNAGLEITPQFLDALLGDLPRRGFDIISLDEALARLRAGASPRPFAVLTFDDGYRDLAEYALPVLERHGAPFTAYVTSGFADGSARLWWVELEAAIRRLDRIDIVAAGSRFTGPCATEAQKAETHAALYWRLRAGGEAELLRVALHLCAEAGVDGQRFSGELCLGWDGVEALARHPLATIGAHSVTHARLAQLDLDAALREMTESRAALEQRLGAPVRHFCYPVGDPTSAGQREFDLAAELGFASAVTTRPGMIFPDHRSRLTALPRLSVNGRHQSLAALDVLLSGAPFALMSAMKKVLAA